MKFLAIIALLPAFCLAQFYNVVGWTGDDCGVGELALAGSDSQTHGIFCQRVPSDVEKVHSVWWQLQDCTLYMYSDLNCTVPSETFYAPKEGAGNLGRPVCSEILNGFGSYKVGCPV